MNRNSVPIIGRYGVGATRIVLANLILDGADDQFEHGLIAETACSASDRVARKPPIASAAIRPQVTTTGSVIGTGPMRE